MIVAEENFASIIPRSSLAILITDESDVEFKKILEATHCMNFCIMYNYNCLFVC